ncbi:MAG TPA: hypothetical protein VFK90_05475 [Anaeromyxobacter sp.]|nr:hypothetical protein [Anaeromyxobacter sp.]
MIGRARIVAMGLAAVLGAALGTALLAGAGDRDGGPESGAEPRPTAGTATAASPGKGAVGVHPQAVAPKKAHVPAGVLVRAATRRAQEREAANPPAPERRRGKDGGEVLSVEIDWHAGASTER